LDRLQVRQFDAVLHMDISCTRVAKGLILALISGPKMPQRNNYLLRTKIVHVLLGITTPLWVLILDTRGHENGGSKSWPIGKK
jgi:hypothetical protein